MNIRSVLGSVASLRTMAITVCVLTNLYFVSIFIVSPNDSVTSILASTRTTTVLLMLLLFAGLRFAMHELASAKDQDLDERQLKLRDDAHRLAYLVVRRVGLGVLIAISLVSGPAIRFYYDNVAFFGNARTNASDLSLALKMWFEPANLFTFVQSLLFVLTFTAFCFPIVVLAWRQSKYLKHLSSDDRTAAVLRASGAEANPLAIEKGVDQIRRQVKIFRIQLTVVAISWPVMLFIGLFGYSWFGQFWREYLAASATSLAVPLMLFTLWVLFAGMLKQRVIFRTLRQMVSAGVDVTSAYRTVHGLAIATGVFSLALPVLDLVGTTLAFWHLGAFGWLAAWFCSLATLISQTASFMVADRAVKRFAAEAKASTPFEL